MYILNVLKNLVQFWTLDMPLSILFYKLWTKVRS